MRICDPDLHIIYSIFSCEMYIFVYISDLDSQWVLQIRPDRQTLYWSATWPKEVEQLSRRSLSNPYKVIVLLMLFIVKLECVWYYCCYFTTTFLLKFGLYRA